MKKYLVMVLLAACSAPAPRIEVASSPAVPHMDSADPALAIDPANGDVLMTWVAGDSGSYNVYFARSADQGATWSAPARVTQTDDDVKPHGQASPRIVAANGTIAVFWPNDIPVAGRRFPASWLRFSRSTDGGRTWTSTVTLNDDTTSALAGHTFHGAVFVPPSTIAVAWLDSRSTDTTHMVATEAHEHMMHDSDATIYMAVSNDLGATWSMKNRRLWDHACPCCRVSLAARPDGSILAAWRGHLEGNVRDPVVGVIGKTETPVRVHHDDWVFAGCPHTGPAVSVFDDGSSHIAWYTGKPDGTGIFYAETRGDSLAFEPPVQIVGAGALPAAHPTMAPAAEGAFVAYDVDESGRHVLSISNVRDGQAHAATLPDSEGADHPQIVALKNGGALVAWTEKRGSSSQVRVATVRS